MSTEDFTLNAKARDDQGKGASRRLRHDNLVPAIVYGGEKDPQNIAIAQNEFVKHLENEAFYSHIVTLVVDGEKQDVILKDLQRHPAKAQLLHADFLRVSRTQKLTTRVPLHFINEESCKGVKLQGGVVAHSLTELEISCLPQDLPEFIEVDLKDAEVGHIVHISDLNLPAGVESVALSHGEDHDQAVVTINKGRGGSGEEAEGEEGGEE
ncbi:ribosomal protein L25/general stress protein Ctc [Teredinibacter turnerae T7901]|uniref:Large ribosomal subunit protein bL25 n=1 Tax=Teredinibacter turnerae (strain ATCC 39867 / T7901) TaxID=377629 RepID=C5BT02_TERTT|nr:50S ribosomal protein L25/general stress protein Ctc [Teredinibacter turnerae]ACR13980.1 ribosomal protein L25/general stress protein Ctc [Teredinibacter turnerae T7901]